MSISAIVWILLFVGLAVMSLQRGIWGVSLYMLTFFLSPDFWWWGRQSFLHGQRWNLYGGIILLVSVLLSRRPTASTRTQLLDKLALAVLANATLVHVLFAQSWAVSSGPYTLLAKFVLLYFLISRAIQSEEDLRILAITIALGGAYIGYEATFNHRGGFRQGRLENLGAPGASGANELACLMTSILPVVGGILFTSKKWYDKLISAISAGLILNIIFLCNSRGALLATVASCFVLLLTARGKARSRALIGLSLGGVAAFVLMGDPQIVSRFFTSFAGGNERDGSASSRLVLWSAGLKMLSDYPLGAGGDGFVAVHGGKYLDTGISRSTHNGFINIANDWGVQGLILQMSFIAVAALRVFKTIGQNARNEQVAFFGSCVLSGLAGFLVSSLFGDYLDQEWGFWFAAIAWGYVRYYGVEPSLRPVQPAPSRVTQVGAQLKPAL